MSYTDLDKWVKEYPLLEKIISLQTVAWINESRAKMNEIKSLPVNENDLYDAEKLWEKFAPYLSKVFPETKSTNGMIESPLKEIMHFKKLYSEVEKTKIEGRLFLKCDNELPVAGSIKARGGFYEVLHFALQLALENNLLNKDDNYEKLADEKCKALFEQYTIGVGSTGNLGLSIGIMSKKLGFKVCVYMSADAKEWKKNLLRSKGAIVKEFSGDFSEAIDAGRRITLADPKGYFVDDENSKYLYLGYSVAAIRLKKQLDELKINIDATHPLFVYSPCGVGGSPGGIAFGLRQIFGDNAHCFFPDFRTMILLKS